LQPEGIGVHLALLKVLLVGEVNEGETCQTWRVMEKEEKKMVRNEFGDLSAPGEP